VIDDAVRRDAVRCALAGIAAVDPGDLVERALTSHAFGPHVHLVSVGKAARPMAAAAAEVLGPYLRRGIVIAPGPVVIPGAPIVAYRGGHPTPSEEGARAAAAVHRMIGALAPDDVLLCLISGGASSLMTLPPPGVTLDDVRSVTTLLLRAGATIAELNCVRKHLDQLKGGRLAALAFPARVVALVLSDVVDDPIEIIASGPTVPDSTTAADAVAVLRERELWDTIPDSIRAHLESPEAESPKPGDMRFAHCTSRIIGSNATAAEAARDHAELLGYRARVVTTRMTGEARDAGRAIARTLCDEAARATSPIALIYAGETTVTVTGTGIGGRNQELALGAAIELDGTSGIAVASLGTDGIDGPTDAAGAVADGATIRRANALGLDAPSALVRNDSYRYWSALGDLVTTGPTGTNVMDIVVALGVPGATRPRGPTA
jgi:glycerate-2-kinase